MLEPTVRQLTSITDLSTGRVAILLLVSIAEIITLSFPFQPISALFLSNGAFNAIRCFDSLPILLS